MELPVWFVFVIGTIIGSFLNVMGLRLLRDEEFVKKPSYCYHCETPLKWFDNIPVASWLFLLGKCRICKTALTPQYLLIELLTGGVFAATYYYFGLTWQTLLLLILFANLIVILITDFREQFIFDINSLGLIPFGIIYACLMGYEADNGIASLGPVLLQCVMAIGFAWLSFWILNFMSQVLFGVEGFGEGDARLLMGIGAFFGLKPVILIFILSFALQVSLTVPLVFFQWGMQKKFKILGLFTGAFSLSLCPYLFVDLLQDPLLRIGITLLFGTLAMAAALKAIKLSQQQQSGLTYLPFGPAICFACGLYVFYGGYLA